MSHQQNLLGLDRQQLRQFFSDMGEKPFRAEQVLKWIHQFGVSDFAQMTNLSKALQAKLAENCLILAPEITQVQKAKDGTRKYLIQLDNGGAIEAVYIPEPSRATLCVSSQVGCALNCQFCHTARQGFQRNLTASEIIGQVWAVFHALKNEGILLPDGRPISNIVMMGMGEPLLNYDNLLPALNLMRDDLAYGFSKRRVTVSTSGVVPMIDQLSKDIDVALALSLHAPTDPLRTQLVPLNKKYPLKEVLAACQRYAADRHKFKITMEYVMLKGVNDKPQHAKQLAKLLQGVPCKVNLIPFNPFENSGFETSSQSHIEHFAQILNKSGLVTTTRKTRGDDIDAACGQLAGKVPDKTKRSQYKERFFKPIIIEQPTPI